MSEPVDLHPEERMLSAGFNTPEEVVELAVAICGRMKRSLDFKDEARRRYAVAQTHLENGLLWLGYARKV